MKRSSFPRERPAALLAGCAVRLQHGTRRPINATLSMCANVRIRLQTFGPGDQASVPFESQFYLGFCPENCEVPPCAELSFPR